MVLPNDSYARHVGVYVLSVISVDFILAPQASVRFRWFVQKYLVYFQLVFNRL